MQSTRRGRAALPLHSCERWHYEKDVAANVCVPAESFNRSCATEDSRALETQTQSVTSKFFVRRLPDSAKYCRNPSSSLRSSLLRQTTPLGFAATVSSFDEVLSGNRENSSRKNFYCHYNLLFLTTPMPCVLRTLPVAALNHLREEGGKGEGESILTLPQPASLSDVEITLRNLVQSTRALPLEKAGQEDWNWFGRGRYHQMSGSSAACWYHLAKNDYSFDALQTNCFGINIKL